MLQEDLAHFEVVHMLRTLGQKLGDHQLVLLSRRMDGTGFTMGFRV